MAEAGLIRRHNVGQSAMFRANSDNRLVEPLAELLFLYRRLLQVVANEFASPAENWSV